MLLVLLLAIVKIFLRKRDCRLVLIMLLPLPSVGPPDKFTVDLLLPSWISLLLA